MEKNGQLILMKTTNRAQIIVSPELISKAISLPNDIKIIGADWKFDSQSVRLFLEGERLPTVAEGEIIPLIMPCVETVLNKETGQKEFKWEYEAIIK